MACPIPTSPDSFASGLLGYLDCQAVSLGGQGYLALAAPGSSVSLLLAALLTLFVALIGYRMLLGETPNAREGVLAVAKVGIVLAFATSWPAYRTTVFDVVLRAPAELAAEIGRPAGLPGASGGLAGRMDATDRAFRILAIRGVGVPTRAQVEDAQGVAPPLFANFDSFALGASRVVFLVGSLGAFALVRLTAGLLLALGPLFIAFLLFALTRGLAEGWLRGLVAATLGSAAIAVILGVELALLEPWLSDLAAQRASNIAIPGIPVAMLATASIFAIAMAGVLAVIGRIAFSLRLPEGIALRSADAARRGEALRTPGIAASGAFTAAAPAEARSRAVAIADSIAAAQRREEQAPAPMPSRAQAVGGSVVRQAADAPSQGGVPLGQSFRPRNTRRVSGSAQNRDRRA